ncbi:hypothetical protein POM88_011736 [Heracleum sosnowskyi]|uniref:Uncharacterized protein n=1 Tax=Heracleum sosnowskyi TaxID=360622 RepID=A0AAD8IYW7_9APIA|nr:hypothetical protein POM88_011736 [Heracleum sosnowskyi]
MEVISSIFSFLLHIFSNSCCNSNLFSLHVAFFLDCEGYKEEKNEQSVLENSTELPAQSRSAQPQLECEQNVRDVESKEQQFNHRRQFQNQRGGCARRGYSNGRGGGPRRGGGSYQNGRNQYNDQPGNYYPRNNYYSNRGSRGGGRGAPGNSNNNGSTVPSKS